MELYKNKKVKAKKTRGSRPLVFFGDLLQPVLIIVSPFISITPFFFARLVFAGGAAVTEFLLIAGGAGTIAACLTVVFGCAGVWKLIIRFHFFFHVYHAPFMLQFTVPANCNDFRLLKLYLRCMGLKSCRCLIICFLIKPSIDIVCLNNIHKGFRICLFYFLNQNLRLLA